MIAKSAPTFEAKIYIAGSLEHIKQVCASFCLDVGLCVTVEPLEFVYTGGAESGARIGLINYPRFPSEPERIRETAVQLASLLRTTLSQQSYSIVFPYETVWTSIREADPVSSARPSREVRE